MSDTPQKVCSKCATPYPATTQYFYADNSRKDKLQRQCKSCRPKKHKKVVAARREELLPEEQDELDMLDRWVAAATKDLNDPKASGSKLRLADIAIQTTIPKKRRPLEARIAERLRQVRATELAQQQQIALEQTKALFPALEVLPIGAEREAHIARLQEHRGMLTGDANASAREYLTAQIAQLTDAIEAERQAEVARVEAATAAKAASDKAEADAEAKKIYDWAKPFLLTQSLELKKRERLRTFCLEMAEKSAGIANKVVARRCTAAYTKLARMLEVLTQDSMPPTDITEPGTSYYTSGFSTSAANWNFRTSLEKALLRHFTLVCVGEKYASELPDAPPPIFNPKPSSEKLENIQSRIDQANSSAPQLEEIETKRQQYWANLKATDPKRFERESKSAILQIHGDDIFSQRQRESLKEFKARDPEVFEKYSLRALEPVSFELPTIIYLCPVWTHANPKARAEWRWPDGRVVEPHEVAFDYRTNTWHLPAEPVDAETNFNKTTGPTAAELKRMSPEAAEFYRDVDAPNAARMFAKPTKITFRKGDRHVEGSGRDFFRHGSWWTAEDIKRAETGYSEKPPIVLPPLPAITVADSFATKPESAAELAKWHEPVETCWQRLERQRKEQQQFEAKLVN